MEHKINTLFGIAMVNPNKPKKDCWKERLELINEDYEGSIYVTKETYHHREEGFGNYDYKYVVEVFPDVSELYDMYGAAMNLYLIVTPENVFDGHIKNIMDAYGIDRDEVNILDIFKEGYCAHIGCEHIETENFDEEYYLDLASSVIPTIDGLSGFYLDRPVNQIGTTGWDMIEWAIKGENPFEKGLKKMQERMQSGTNVD